MSEISNGPEINATDMMELTTEVVAAFFSNNTVAPDAIPGLINSVHATLSSLGGNEGVTAEKLRPAVPIKKSINPEHLVCLEDGRKLKMLKRHLRTDHGMTPEQYRERWGLPHDYPMVAPQYAEWRSDFAKRIGLGTRRRRKPKATAK